MELALILGVVVLIILFFIFSSKSGAKLLAEREAVLDKLKKQKQGFLAANRLD